MRRTPSPEQALARHVDTVYRLFYSWVGNREDAEDLTTQTFLKVARHLDQPRPPEDIDAWIVTAGRRVLADHWQWYYPRSALRLLDEDSGRDNPGQGQAPLADSEADRVVRTILAALPDHDRRILELRFLHGFSVEDTARELGLTPGHALALQRRALAKALRVAALRDPRDETAPRRG